MKKIIFIIASLSFLNDYAQSTSEKRIIDKIEKQILNKNIRKETFNESDSGTIFIYLKGNTPILIEKQTGISLHTFDIIGNKRIERDYVTFINAKFYIKNWKKNIYIRVGQITKPEAGTSSTIVMPINYIFDYNKVQIENIITKKNQPQQIKESN